MNFLNATADGILETAVGGILTFLLWLFWVIITLLIVVAAVAIGVAARRELWFRGRRSFLLRAKSGVELEEIDSEAGIRPAVASLGSGEISFVRWSQGGSVRMGLVLCGVKKPARVASMIAEAVGCESREVKQLDREGLPGGVMLYGRRTNTDALSAGEAPLSKFAEVTTSILSGGDGEGLLIFSMSKMKKWESRRLRAFLSNDEAAQVGKRATFTSLGAATAKASSSDSLRCRVVARAADESRCEALLSTTSSLDGWPHTLRGAAFKNYRMFWVALTGFVVSLIARLGDYIPTLINIPLLFIWGALAVVGALSFPRLTEMWFQRWVNAGVAFGERPWNAAPRWHLIGRLRSQRDSDPSSHEENYGWGAKKTVRFAHPLTRRMLTVTANQMAGIVFPPPRLMTSAGDAPAALEIPAPKVLLGGDGVGVRTGFDINDAFVRISANERYGGVVAVGAPGTGKTTLVLNIFGDDALMRKWGDGMGGGPLRNGNMTLLCIDVKGDIADRAISLLQKAGYTNNEFNVIDLTDPNGIRIKWLDPDNPKESAGRFVDALEYAFPEGSIGGENKPYLNMLLTIAAAVEPEIAQKLGFEPYDPIRSALILAGGDANPEAQNTLFNRLMEVVQSDQKQFTESQIVNAGSVEEQIASLGEGNIGSATDEFDPLNPQNNQLSSRWPVLHRALLDFGGLMRLNQRERDNRLRSSINRLRELMANPHIFAETPGRPAASISQIIQANRPVVVNVRGNGFAMTESSVTKIASIFLHLLWTQARQECLGWQQQGRSLTIYCDEIAAIAGGGSGDDVIRDMYDQGRSLGIEAVYALQRYGQLPPRTQSAIRNFAHKVAFRLPDPDSAVEAHRALSLDGSSWDTQTIQTFPNFNAVARLSAGGIPQSPFTLHVIDDKDWDPRTFPNQRYGSVRRSPID